MQRPSLATAPNDVANQFNAPCDPGVDFAE
jgi:hypothetical protein